MAIDRLTSGRLALGALLGLALLCIFAIGCTTTALLQPPSITSNLSAEQNHHIVLDSLASRRWMVESEKPGEIIAVYSRRQHRARVRITYTKSAIQIGYVDSENLDCEPAPEGGCLSINRAYNRWVVNLNQDIANHVAVGR
jgi:hypothetical protein